VRRRLKTDNVFLTKRILTSAWAMAILDEYPSTIRSLVSRCMPLRQKISSHHLVSHFPFFAPAIVSHSNSLASQAQSAGKIATSVCFQALLKFAGGVDGSPPRFSKAVRYASAVARSPSRR
jgi:hypothetical protein